VPHFVSSRQSGLHPAVSISGCATPWAALAYRVHSHTVLTTCCDCTTACDCRLSGLGCHAPGYENDLGRCAPSLLIASSVCSVGSSVVANFGSEPYLFDLEVRICQQRANWCWHQRCCRRGSANVGVMQAGAHSDCCLLAHSGVCTAAVSSASPFLLAGAFVHVQWAALSLFVGEKLSDQTSRSPPAE
jgi:hypothetical protein